MVWGLYRMPYVAHARLRGAAVSIAQVPPKDTQFITPGRDYFEVPP